RPRATGRRPVLLRQRAALLYRHPRRVHRRDPHPGAQAPARGGTGADQLLELMIRTALVLAIISMGLCGCGKRTDTPTLVIWLQDDQCIAFGGIGIISHGVYVVAKSDRNEILIGNGSKKAHWSGLSASDRQVVFVFKGKVF